MRRLALIAIVLIAAGLAVGFRTSSSRGAGGSFNVRAIFDDAAFAVTGEDVRIAGANVGSIQSLDVTPDKKAAVTISINDRQFTPFYSNATCVIRPQSLIGEKYVDCDPGTSNTRPLAKITHGPGSGSYLLPVTQTSSPIDSDIVQDISQEPVRESLAVIIDEFGTALASRGSDLNEVIHRANPALGDTDKVFQILARQSHQLAQLSRDSDTVLAPLARDRHEISDFIVQANTTSVASATRAADIARSFQLLPSFLRQLRPLMADLGGLADQGTPLMNDLGQSASALDRQFVNLTPFANAARTSLINLGNSAAQSQPALIATEPLAQRLKRLGTASVPSFALLDRLLASLDKTGGLEQLMGLLFNGASAGNGFDSIGHYLRTELEADSCTGYAPTAIPGCAATFTQGTSAGVRQAGAASVKHANANANANVGSARRARSPVSKLVLQAVGAATPRVHSAPPLSSLLTYLIGEQK